VEKFRNVYIIPFSIWSNTTWIRYNSIKEGRAAAECDTAEACVKGPYPGTCGYVAVSTGNLVRVEAYLKRRGAALCKESRRTDAKSITKAICLAEEFAGFAIQLVQN
jgi:hypothetical protein